MEKKLQRNEQDKVIAGVCAGLADYFDIDPTWVRVAFVVAVFAGFSGVLAYVILWVAVPAKPFAPFNSGFNPYNTDYRVYEDKNFSSGPNPNYNKTDEPFTPYVKSKHDGNGKVIFGIIFIALGGFFLLDEFHLIPFWFDLGKLWPLVFIIPGLMMISKARKNEKQKKAMNKEHIYTETTSEPVKPDTDQPSI
ncbi:MAG: phage shock protein PspC [Sphingobacteriales bacterium]|nr:phage shock protein PspC [Sphingobacteriales bacterium]